MFRRLSGPPRPSVSLLFEGAEVEALEGDTLAAALLAAGVPFRRESAVSAAPRAPFCMMGACFECLVEIDGAANRQACLEPVREGMSVRLQPAARGVGP